MLSGRPVGDCWGCSPGLSAFFQVVLINAIKDVAKALSDLIGATKGAASKPADDPSMYQLKGAAKVEWDPKSGASVEGGVHSERSIYKNNRSICI